MDSRYAFGVVHDFGTLWCHHNFLTSTGKHNAHHTLVAALLDVILLPKTIAVIKCQDHKKDTSEVAKGSVLADSAAKHATLAEPLFSLFAGNLYSGTSTGFPY